MSSGPCKRSNDSGLSPVAAAGSSKIGSNCPIASCSCCCCSRLRLASTRATMYSKSTGVPSATVHQGTPPLSPLASSVPFFFVFFFFESGGATKKGALERSKVTMRESRKEATTSVRPSGDKASPSGESSDSESPTAPRNSPSSEKASTWSLPKEATKSRPSESAARPQGPFSTAHDDRSRVQ